MALLKIDDCEKIKEALKYIRDKKMTVSAAEAYIDEMVGPKEEKIVPGSRKFIIKDMRIFYNTIDRAVDTVRKAGITISSQKKEENGVVELVIKIPARVQYKR